jgi:hypothetical protein
MDNYWRRVTSNKFGATSLRQRWWIFWNLVIRGRSLQVEVWAKSGDVMAKIAPDSGVIYFDDMKAKATNKRG